MTLENATITVSVEINSENIKGTLAVININTQSDELSLQIIRMLESKLFRNRDLHLVSRKQVEATIAEQEFGLSGYVDDDSVQKIGHLLGAKYILTGEITKPESKFFLNIQILEAESARLVYSNIFEIDKSELQNYEKKIDPKPSNTPKQKPQGLRF
jgi:TolB-like protein